MATADFFGSQLDAPEAIAIYGNNPSSLVRLISNLFRLAIFAIGIIAMINVIVSGIQYIGSTGNPEAIKKASSRIWMSLLGLVIVAGSLVLAGIIGAIFFGNPYVLINPIIYGPGT